MTEPCATLVTSLRSLFLRELGFQRLGIWSSKSTTCPRHCSCLRHHTCLRRRPLGRPLVMLSSHTHTTVLAPEVMMISGDGHTAHRQRPQAARFSNIIRICGRHVGCTLMLMPRGLGQSDRGTWAGLDAAGLSACHGNQEMCHLFRTPALVTKFKLSGPFSKEFIL